MVYNIKTRLLFRFLFVALFLAHTISAQTVEYSNQPNEAPDLKVTPQTEEEQLNNLDQELGLTPNGTTQVPEPPEYSSGIKEITPRITNRVISNLPAPDKHFTYKTIQVTDTILVRKLTERVLPNNHPLDGHLEFSLSFQNPKRIVVMQNGTEICRIDATYSNIFLKQNPAFFRKSPIESMLEDEGEISSSTLKELFTFEKVISYGLWKPGINIDFGYEIERDHQKFYWYKSHLHISALHRFGHLYVGGSFSLQDYEGDMFGPEYQFLFLDSIRARYGNNYEKFGYSLKVGTEFITYELKYDPWPVPDYYWLEVEHNFRKNEYVNVPGSREGADPEKNYGNIFLRPFDEIHTDELSSNYSHNIRMKIGKFHFHWLHDDDIYQAPIYNFAVKDLPAIWGRWGFGVTNSTYIWVPHIYVETDNSTAASVDIKDYTLDIYTPKIKLGLVYHSNEYYLFQINLNLYFNYYPQLGGL